MDSLQLAPIGIVHSPFKEKFGVPRQSGLANEIQATVELYPPYNDYQAFRGLENFDYIWIVFYFHQSDNSQWSPVVRPPRLGGNKKVGVFATRSPFRPNGLGLSLVKLGKININNDKVQLLIWGHDLVDGTPILDIKPYIKETESQARASSGWTEHVDKNEDLDVIIAHDVEIHYSKDLLERVTSYLKLDPRPSYQNDDRLYKNKFETYDISWRVKGSCLFLEKIELI